jgi:hypothetical protein
MKNTDSTAPARYTVESVPLPEDIRARIIGDMRSEICRNVGTPWLNSLIIIGFFALLTGGACYFGNLGWTKFALFQIGGLALAAFCFFGSSGGRPNHS